jgi:CHAT domain-containing protein
LGATILNGDVTTSGNQTYNDGVTLNGDRQLTAGGTITANSLLNAGQDINISAQNINTGSITSAGGNISLTSTQGNITTQNLNSAASQGGNLKLKSATNVTTGAINTSGANGNAGDITIQALQDIEVTNINAQSSGGQGGTVIVQTPSQIRVTDTVPGTNASVITIGSLGGGDITLQYDGDPNLLPTQRTPFIVGDATVNGSAGELTSGDFSINSGEFYFTEQRGNVAIVSVPSPITSSENPGNVVASTVVNATPTLPTSPVSLITINEAKNFLQDIEEATAERPAVIYVSFKPRGLNLKAEDAFTRAEAESSQEYRLGLGLEGNDSQPTISTPPADSDELDLVIVTAQGEPLRIPVQGILRQQVLAEAEALWKLTSDELSQRQDYEPLARRLYQWLITPLEPTLAERKINNLLFVMPLGLRVLPVASLIDPEGKFLVEKYSSGFAPSLSLNNNAYKDVRQRLLLAMGASQFADPNALGPLPAVDVELPAISNIWGDTKYYPNQDFTIDNLRSFLEKTPYGVIHISTHAEFDTDKNYIQFYDNRLALEQIRTLGLNDPSVELLVLSACRTAIGNETAELGFAGLAVKAGVKSVLASLWWVGDTGTVAFMTDFYSQLKSEKVQIKAEALRNAQINMLKGRVQVEGGKIMSPQGVNSIDLTHPYYWAPFTLIGSPW